MSQGYKLTGFGCVYMCGNPNCDHVPRWDFRTLADTPTATDREARAMLAALEARTGDLITVASQLTVRAENALQAIEELRARIDALEAKHSGGGGTIQATMTSVINVPKPGFCECGHSHGAHDFTRVSLRRGSPCQTKEGAGWCGCEEWRPVAQVTP